ncbi:hypothetical protein [Paulownia witches'-broom phytoplasma]|uniref:hypothetical protein n=1 Tax=Paulownia witches'-broom phytoplasma TaxID=39647 RepID=UPI001CEC90BE|nr:hypothetical protein [Paulownia witches'-broom phytoplasma]GLH60566.1 hypothetical protein PAWBP_3040 [Paulownia witches'-broom phytoplasma]
MLNYFQVHKGTIKRWVKQQSIPKNYDTDLKKIINQLEIEYPHIDIVKFQNNCLKKRKKI